TGRTSTLAPPSTRLSGATSRGTTWSSRWCGTIGSIAWRSSVPTARSSMRPTEGGRTRRARPGRSADPPGRSTAACALLTRPDRLLLKVVGAGSPRARGARNLNQVDGGTIRMFGLIRWAPFDSAFRLHREIDDLFSRFLGEAGDQPRGAGESAPAWLPAIETYTREGTLGVRVALPGVDPKDVEVSVTDNFLTIKGERKLEDETRDGGY